MACIRRGVAGIALCTARQVGTAAQGLTDGQGCTAELGYAAEARIRCGASVHYRAKMYCGASVHFRQHLKLILCMCRVQESSSMQEVGTIVNKQ